MAFLRVNNHRQVQVSDFEGKPVTVRTFYVVPVISNSRSPTITNFCLCGMLIDGSEAIIEVFDSTSGAAAVDSLIRHTALLMSSI